MMVESMDLIDDYSEYIVVAGMVPDISQELLLLKHHWLAKAFGFCRRGSDVFTLTDFRLWRRLSALLSNV